MSDGLDSLTGAPGSNDASDSAIANVATVAALAGRRVLFISEATAFGGHEAMALRAADGLSRAGVEVVFRCWAGNDRLRRNIANANDAGAAIRIDDGAAADRRLGSLRWWTRRQALAAARDFLNADRSFARVLVQGRIDSGLVTLHAARALGAPLISYLPMAHTLRQMGVGTLPDLRERVLRHHYASVPAFIVIDAAVAADLRRRGASGPIAVVENWIPPPAADAAGAVGADDPVTARLAARAALGLPPRPRMVAMIGRIDFRQKGHLHLLQALASPSGREQGVHWLIVGDGPDLPALRQQVDALGLADRCHFLAWIDGGMDRVYQAVDAVALPSNFEGVPLVMMEALARRLPVIGSDIDGMASWLPPMARFDRTAPASLLRSLDGALDAALHTAYEDAFGRATRATASEPFVAAWAAALIRLADVGRR